MNTTTDNRQQTTDNRHYDGHSCRGLHFGDGLIIAIIFAVDWRSWSWKNGRHLDSDISDSKQEQTCLQDVATFCFITRLGLGTKAFGACLLRHYGEKIMYTQLVSAFSKSAQWWVENSKHNVMAWNQEYTLVMKRLLLVSLALDVFNCFPPPQLFAKIKSFITNLCKLISSFKCSFIELM